jgi:hypothetical protein
MSVQTIKNAGESPAQGKGEENGHDSHAEEEDGAEEPGTRGVCVCSVCLCVCV